MKKTMILVAIVWVLSFGMSANAEEKKQINILETADFARQISYALGYDIFKNVNQHMDLDLEYFIKGVTDNSKGELWMEKDKMRQMLMAYQRIARQKQMEKTQLIFDKNKADEAKFFEGNKLKEGVITRSSGLQYKVIETGDGPLPGPGDTVECQYKGSLLDGTVFDSSFSRGKPAVFQVSNVIQGWKEALQLMPVGSRWELYVPADLAYGDQGAGDAIMPGQTLIFEVELLGIIN